MTDGPQFARESARTVIPDMQALIQRHWTEVGHYEDMPIDPDFGRYQQLETAGVLRVYTARVKRELVGYATYLVATGLHYRTVMMGQEATVYLAPEWRKGLTGMRFMKFIDDALISEGCTHISKHVKQRRNFGPVLARMGYQMQDQIWTRKL